MTISGQIHKYPRTQHIEGSRLQAGDEDLAQVPFSALRGQFLVVEEKLDGANCGVSFSSDGELQLQSRGHYLVGGGRERHFDLFKAWAQSHEASLRERLGDRYVMYGEWLYAKHTVFYDRLPHYFMEFDVLDTIDGSFLSTERRRELSKGVAVEPVPVLHEGPLEKPEELTGFIRPSLYKSKDWRERLAEGAKARELDVERVQRETDGSDFAEGLYIKVEEQGRVLERYKFVRASFLAAVFAAEGHWLNRPILPNELAPGVDLFGASK
ncbi:MAG: RNA ligase family protein [Myxococcales bacterium]